MAGLPWRRLPAGVVWAVGAVLSMVGFQVVERWEGKRVQVHFERVATSCVAAVQKTVALGLEVLRSVESFYAASQRVERQEFRVYAGHTLARHRAVATLQWAPRVGADERAAHEAAARGEGLADYRVAERDGSGRGVAARARAEYFPVYFAEPADSGEGRLGLDLGSDAAYGEVMARARDEAVPVATGRLPLAGRPEGEFGVRVFLPIYRNEVPHGTVEERRANLAGFVVGVFRIPDLVEEAVGDWVLHGAGVHLFDEAAPPSRQGLCSYPAGREDDASASGILRGLRRTGEVEFAGRRWSIVCVPTGELAAEARPWLPWAALAAGLVVTGIASAYVVVVVGRTARVEARVARRTDELTRANRDLAEQADRRRRVEGALRESEERFRALVESTSDWVWEVDADGVYTYVSPQVRALLGYEPEEIIGKTPFALMPPAEAVRIAAEFRAIAKARQSFAGLVNTNLRKDGERVILESSGVPFFGEHGELRGYRGTDRDITARKRVEEALRQAQEDLERRVRERTAELDQAVRSLQAEVAERTRAEEQIRRQTAVLEGINEVFRESLTCLRDEDVARTCLAVAEKLTGSRFGYVGELNPAGRFDTIALSDPGWTECRVPKGEAERRIRDMEIRGLHGEVLRSEQALIANEPRAHAAARGVPEGHPPLSAFLGVPLKQAGRTIGMIGLANKAGGYTLADQEAVGALSVAFVEALMRKRAELALRRAHDELEARVQQRTTELARSNAELEQFAYVASHDLQEPLRMVGSYLQLLAQRYRGKLDGAADDFIQYAVDGATRMQQLINDLLTYSRVGTQGREFVPTACEAVLERVVRTLAAPIAESGAAVTHGPLPTLRADETQMGQLLQNLVGNALRFRGEAPPRVHVAAEERPTEWVFSVRDNGIGIAPEHHERIFLIFQRLHTREEYPGTGIGLAVCQRIVERHGGRIWVESAPGQGSTFYFTVPKAPGQGAEAAGKGTARG
jgi:PAS domain S-box-containing protein